MIETVEVEWEGVKPRDFLATPRVPSEEAILVGHVGVNLRVKLVGERLAPACVELVTGEIAVDRRRVEARREELLGHGVDCQPSRHQVVVRNYVAACSHCRVSILIKRTTKSLVGAGRVVELDRAEAGVRRCGQALACSSVKARLTQLREVARPFFVGEDRDESGRRRVVKPLALVISEVEQLILLDGSAHGTPEHVPAHLGFGFLGGQLSGADVIGPLRRIEDVIAEELEASTMDIVRP